MLSASHYIFDKDKDKERQIKIESKRIKRSKILHKDKYGSESKKKDSNKDKA